MSRTRIRTILEMIKFEHSVFALPFALTGALLAFRDWLHGEAERQRRGCGRKRTHRRGLSGSGRCDVGQRK